MFYVEYFGSSKTPWEGGGCNVVSPDGVMTEEHLPSIGVTLGGRSDCVNFSISGSKFHSRSWCTGFPYNDAHAILCCTWTVEYNFITNHRRRPLLMGKVADIFNYFLETSFLSDLNIKLKLFFVY